jgi:phosphoribosylaminoimidazole (AIR) synthetase
LIIALPQEKVSEALSILSAHGETAWQIGTISSKTGDASVVM